MRNDLPLDERGSLARAVVPTSVGLDRLYQQPVRSIVQSMTPNPSRV